MKRINPSLRIGLLGGGQLARMLALKGHELGFEMWVLSEKSTDPAALVAAHHVLGSLSDESALRGFVEPMNAVTFESEFLDSDLLNRVLKNTRATLLPSADLMGKLQDRLSQKQLLADFKLASAPFVPVRSVADAETFFKKHKSGIVLKQRRFGYDGYGTFMVRTSDDLKKITNSLNEYRHGFIAEQLVKFKRELAITLVRDKESSFAIFPLVESKQVDARCLWVKGPIRHAQTKRLVSKLKKFMNDIHYVGALSFELFETNKGLWINELAPRVHNSCHYSLNAMSLDQFSAHLIAISGQSLPQSVPLTKGFAMMNLLGSSHQKPEWSWPIDANLHWYGKLENRPGRKMGHLNVTADSPDKALKKVLAVRKRFLL